MKIITEYLELSEKIMTKKAHVAVVGLGYVGLPHALHYSRQGYSVQGIDIAKNRIRSLQKGLSYIDDISNQEVVDFMVKNQVFSNYHKIKQADIILINVPTPIDEFNQPDVESLASACEEVIKNAQVGQLIILQSTSFPTTTRKFLVEPLEKAGWQVGKDIFVAFSPERVDPGNQTYTVENTAKVVGGYTPECTQLSELFFGDIAVPVSSLEAAEMVKLYENTFRFVNIGFSDEMTQICDTLDLNVFEIIEAAGTKPHGFMKFYPSVKIGGHCINVDPYYLKWFMASKKLATPIINASSTVDDSMNNFTVSKILKILAQHEIPSFSAKVAIIGVTYKKNVADLRMSAAPNLVHQLREFGAEVDLYDPYVDSMTVDEKNEEVSAINYSAINHHDLVVILTDHDNINYHKISRHAPLILDAKGILSADHYDNWYGI